MRPLLLILLLTSALAAQDTPWVWWEGEDAVETDFDPHSAFEARHYGGAAELLSGGSWLANSGPRNGRRGHARWEVEVPAAGQYDLWVRKFWKHGPFRWRFGRDEWRDCGRDCGLEDNVTLATHICANWVYLGAVELAAGRHDFEIELSAGRDEELTACFDAFCLSPGPFQPRGRLRPDERAGLAAEGWFAFEPALDGFGESPLDLRHLNEEEAGATGFVEVEGGRFQRGDGEPLKLWGVNVGAGVLELGAPSLRYLARKLARLGVNAVRIHTGLFEAGGDPAELDETRLGRLHLLVAELKSQGIYTALSFYFPLWFRVEPGYELEGYETMDNKVPFALLFFDERMQEIHQSWARGLLTTKNPHTGLSLAKDPAVAYVEILNEDSFFFWTFSASNIPNVQREKLEAAYGKWLRKRHGSLARAAAAWGGAGEGRDAPEAGRMALLDAWHMTPDGAGQSAAKRARMGDQLRFLAETQREFYEDTAKFLRRKLKVKCPLVCSNWITADATVLDPLERWTYTAGDISDRHAYFGGRHEGDAAGYSVRVGHRYEDRSALFSPQDTPFASPRLEDMPEIFSEIGWPNPNRFKAEFPFLCATQGSLAGADGWFFFALDGAFWDSSASKFPLAVPSILGQFPALALAFRRGDVEEGPVVVREVLDVDGLYAYEGSSVQAARNLDALRDPGRGGAAGGSVDPLAFFVGRVEQSFGRGKTKLTALGDAIDREAGLVRSATGELVWSYGAGLATVDTPRFQGACGFLGEAGRVALGDVAIALENEYASVAVIALDDEPLARSARVLVQVVSEERPYGFRTEGDRIADLGGYPLNVRRIRGSVELPAHLTRATVLDANGQPRGPAELEDGRLTLPADALYVLVE